jgi:3-oxoacyl-[acyl-carrier-protein] synthase II
MLACHVTIIHGLLGPSNTITCADASSHLAIGEAFRTVQRGDADLAICGGAESKVNPMGHIRQVLVKRLTERNENPGEAVRPFDEAASGTATAEGGGLLILEELEHARERGAQIYAELVGFGASQDAHSITEPDPGGHSYGKAIGKALADANLPPAAVDLLVPCGIGIKSHDQAELNGLSQVFGAGLERVAMAPLKGQLGSLAAGSSAEAVAALLSIKHSRIPPAVNTRKPLDNRKLNAAPQARDRKLNVAVSSVYSLGGQNAALVFKALQSS